MSIIVDISLAIICFAGSCHNVLVGQDTPRGDFVLAPYTIEDPRYGGDLLVFNQDSTGVYAIHRIIEVDGQQRAARINSPYPEHRITITAGCVNVTPEVFDLLMNCCSTSKLTIK